MVNYATHASWNPGRRQPQHRGGRWEENGLQRRKGDRTDSGRESGPREPPTSQPAQWRCRGIPTALEWPGSTENSIRGLLEAIWTGAREAEGRERQPRTGSQEREAGCQASEGRC